MPSRDDIDELSAPPARADRRPLPPIGFWSYARRDDELSRGKLTALRALLMQELQQQYGRESIHLFQDMSTIEHGENWERVIRAALDQSSFFIPIITPNFLQSEWCTREVQIFREREKELYLLHPDLPERSRIFPIHFIDVEDVDPEDPVAFAFLQTLQWFDFRPFRHRSLEDMPVHEALANLAASMRKLLKHKVAWPDSPDAPVKTSEEAVREAATLIIDSPHASKPPPLAEPPPMAPERPIEVGDVLNGIFQVKRLIRSGGMGQVYEGLNVNNDERVAIKVLLPALASDAKITQLFYREARTLTDLNHEALVQYRLLAKETQLGVLYIVMAFIDGDNLGDALDRIDRSPDAIARLLRRLAGGLAAAHRAGAIHRDVSLDNVMLPNGILEQAKIIDFGIAKEAAGRLPTIIGESFAGKLSFVAPEQLGAAGGKVGTWTDVYSLGLVILGVAGGKKVAMGDTIGEAISCRGALPDLSPAPEALRPLLADMLNPDPAERLQTMDEVIARLAQGSPPAAGLRQAKDKAEAEAARLKAEREAEARRHEETEQRAKAEAERERAEAEQRAERERRDAERRAERERQVAELAAAAAVRRAAKGEEPLEDVGPVRRLRLWLALASGIAVIVVAIILLSRSGPAPEPSANLSSPAATPTPTQPPTAAVPTRPPLAHGWLEGRWGTTESCASALTIQVHAHSLTVNFGGQPITRPVADGATQNLVRTRNGDSYRRSGPSDSSVDVIENGIPYTIWRCP